MRVYVIQLRRHHETVKQRRSYGRRPRYRQTSSVAVDGKFSYRPFGKPILYLDSPILEIYYEKAVFPQLIVNSLRLSQLRHHICIQLSRFFNLPESVLGSFSGLGLTSLRADWAQVCPDKCCWLASVFMNALLLSIIMISISLGQLGWSCEACAAMQVRVIMPTNKMLKLIAHLTKVCECSIGVRRSVPEVLNGDSENGWRLTCGS